ncbi:PTS sugar transporter subunit IIB [Streptococcus pluranimalium]|uniref:PTS galactitol transporter subunit IIB n=1 Tax=Streptococcus pluranimalium TaxID=82348 RepID=A0A2L0D292_9STRE|nr:PTS sugar transporter subunit IIB [Streptococcus pluranimalium]AUW95916.1 PTS galactitol transporter subunit IIB [Streptococcus pluranimalium]MXQ49286.1 PTS galactitol transporter subunit IIB [Streptococcus pneumoniae]
MSKVKVLVACGAGIATSTVVLKKIEDLFARNNIDAQITQIKIAEAASLQDSNDILITTTMLPTEYRIPAIKAMAFLTGINQAKVEQEILDEIAKIQGN